jgi:hypothetical protein
MFCLSITSEAKPSTKVEDEASLMISNVLVHLDRHGWDGTPWDQLLVN